MTRVGILGGTFNPPHMGHLIMANEAYHSLGLDEVRFMPNAIAPHKEVHGADAAQRLKMTQLAIEDYPQFRIEDFEIRSGGVSYTFNTISELIAKEKDKEFYFIIGGDTVAELNTWHRIEELAAMIQFVGIGRPGYDAATDFPVMMIDSPEMHISSTMLRERVAAARPLTFFVPEKVEAYIRKEGLYESEQDASTR
ncbi:nicotinate-nucleotide adenylyltransferase [Planococcus beigongshangi]|uniref:nicotinate-nucleotide adenylyltransferase n=1 Tax=Planococcus beigongshangi TaxID=2782536 RepID=UPI00193C232B|nr:nicotinate-nucleotide adenylyltransferase [Planococcus beigongshangi]